MGENTGCGTIIAIIAGIGLIVSIITSVVLDIELLSLF